MSLIQSCSTSDPLQSFRLSLKDLFLLEERGDEDGCDTRERKLITKEKKNKKRKQG